MAATFVQLANIDIDRFPEADAYAVEAGFGFVEVDEGDISLQYRIDFSEILSAADIIGWAERENEYVTVGVDDLDAESIAAFVAAGWREQKAYWSDQRSFVREDR